MVVLIFFKGFPESRKIWRFSWPRTCEKNVIFGHFTYLHFSHPNQQICAFQGSCGQLVVVSIIFKGFPESQKIWRFSWPLTCNKLSFLGISHFCIFLTKISKYAHFKSPVVNWWWWFSSFLKAFQKVDKFKDFHDRGPATNCHFWVFHIFAYFSPKSANMHISRVLWSSGGDFHHFKRLSRKSKKFDDFHDRGPARKMSFLGISHFCIFLIQISKYAHFKGPVVNWWWLSSFLKAFQKVEKIWRFSWPRTYEKNVIFGHFTFFSSKSANMHISRVLWSIGGDFHHFKRLSRKSKNLKIFMTADLWKKSFLGISHFCIFLTQISKYAHFKGPVVNCWWLSSF